MKHKTVIQRHQPGERVAIVSRSHSRYGRKGEVISPDAPTKDAYKIRLYSTPAYPEDECYAWAWALEKRPQ